MGVKQDAPRIHLTSFAVPQLAFLLRALARTDTPGQAGLTELESRIVIELQHYGELTMTSVVGLVGNDKSQVSRALTRLRAAKIVRREELRSPLALTSHGGNVAARMQAGGRRHNRLVLTGVEEGDQAFFMTVLSHFTRRAELLLQEERRLDADRTEDRGRKTRRVSKLEPPSMSGQMVPEIMLVRVVALATLLHRSSSLAFKRLASLSNTDSLVLAYAWEYSPISTQQISELAGRGKGQIERTAVALADLGLIERGKSLSSHDWILLRAESGSRTYEKLIAEVNRRESVMTQDLSSAELKRFWVIHERIAGNAMSALARTR